jgi:predicted  nucleic acid-binding Zn-ribbon protein
MADLVPIPDWVYWQCVNCGQIDAGDKQTPHGCTQCGADAWRTPPQTAHIDRDSTLD